MQPWNDLLDWIRSDSGWRIISTAIIPFVAIVVAGFVAAGIGRGTTKRVIAQRDHETRSAAVAALIAAGHGAASWHSQSPASREHAERLASQADVTVRLLPIAGASLAADWATHQLAEMRTNSVSYSYQAEQTLEEYRDRLVEWLHRPSRAKKLFAADVERWQYAESAVDPVVLEQQRWAEEQYSAVNHESAERAPELPLNTPTAVLGSVARE
ncbi:hypothetical protein ACFPJ4_07100 [Lysinimonas soli]|uniref:DUF4129 domain-containing protein n=1 Tax=Lysinimonas soli TaxID=1074233 RepID=A0ABW0NN88_9MICO